jgi:hypothetical protein
MDGATGSGAGSYRILFELATGGMGVVALARHHAAGGFERLVVIKRIHPHLLANRDVADMLVDEARLASQIQHPNVVPVDDVVDAGGELLLVQPYVESVTLTALIAAAAAAGEALGPPIVARVLADALAGLDGAHHAADLRGRPLEIVHRDVSPHNILVGTDGRSRVIDFGIAKAARRITVTETGTLKGKIGYMAPEQLRRRPVDARADVFAAGVVLYEALTGARPFAGEDEGDTLLSILIGEPDPPSLRVPALPPAVDALVARALAGDRDDRYASAAEMLEALEQALPPAPPREVALAVQRLCGPVIEALQERVRAGLDAPALAAPLEAPPAPPAATTRRAPRSLLTAIAFAVTCLLVVSLVVFGARARPHEEATAGSSSVMPAGPPSAPAPEGAASAAPVVPPTRAEPTHAAPSVSARPRLDRRAKDAPPPPSTELHPSPYGRPP